MSSKDDHQTFMNFFIREKMACNSVERKENREKAKADRKQKG